jgi:class I fructose-bisphosphate aldolase
MSAKVKQIINCYESETPGVKANIHRMLSAGKLSGTGKLVILPVDQGFEHGPDRSFAINPLAYDPHYHFKLAIEAGLSAYAAPLGMIEAGADTFAGQIPLILKVNSNNSLMSEDYNTDQAITATVDDALKLGCSAVGFTIYPGSDYSLEMFEEIREISAEAKAKGLAVVVWSYPRGGDLPKEQETCVDVVAYAAHIAALLGAHIIKVKPPKSGVYDKKAKEVYEKHSVKIETLEDRIRLVKKACLNGRRIVIFSGGESKSDQDIFDEITQIAKGGGNGSIIGRNTFQRPFEDAKILLDKIIQIYKLS